jgi:hypothetical protein
MPRQMLYQAGNYNINLSLDYVEQSPAINLIGQPTPLHANLPAVAGADVELLKESLVVHTTTCNEFGAFIFNQIPDGIYDLRITLAEVELDILGLEAVRRPLESERGSGDAERL